MSSPGEVLSKGHHHNRLPMGSPSCSSPTSHFAMNVANPYHGQSYQPTEGHMQSLRQTMANNATMTGNHATFFDMFANTDTATLQHGSSYDGNWTWGQHLEEDKVIQSGGNDWSSFDAAAAATAASLHDEDSLHGVTSLTPSTQSSRLLTPNSTFEAEGREFPSLQSQSFPWSNSPTLPSSMGTSVSTASDSPRSQFVKDTISPASVQASLEQKYDDDEESEEDGEEEEGEASTQSVGQEKTKIQRRQGVTCDQCRSKHIRCVNEAGVGHQCSRCQEKGLECTRNYAPPSRRYPRPSRTGKRIEQARMMHGTLANEGNSMAVTWERKLSPQMLLQARPILFSGDTPGDAQLTNRVMAGCVSLRLLTCFFACAHMQMPIVDFHNFSARYNFSQGDCRIMAIMANGGDPLQSIPSAKQSAPGLSSTIWPPGCTVKSKQKSTLATPGSSEALVAVMHAWAALYTDMPLAFGETKMNTFESDWIGKSERYSFESSRESRKSTDTSPTEYVMGANGKLRRPKRKQGVACDTCRLRRLRCDKLERPEGMGCSRCEDKRIVCTDDYIQSKRKKVEKNGDADKERENNQEEEGIVGSAPSLARNVVQDWTTEQQRGETSLEQKSWINESVRMTGPYRFGRGREALAYGKARQPFFQALLQKAIDTVVHHRLREEPSAEGIQALMLLAQLLDLARFREGDALADAAASHITTLGLESVHEVDERDRKAVEGILGHMQRRRLWCCVWTRDAIVSGLYRQTPTFDAERPLGIKGNNTGTAAKASSSTMRESDSQQQHWSEEKQQSEKPATTTTATTATSSSSTNSPDLNGEMGLSFSILALMQVGALSRFMSRHVDNIDSSMESGAIRQPSLHRNSALPSFVEVRKLAKACQALWKSIDSLLLFFDQCSLKARRNMDNLQPFQPLGWIATIKIAGAMLELATFRNLAERIEMARMTIEGNGGIMREEQGLLQIFELKQLVDQSQKRTLNCCRRIVKLVEFLLAKNVFQTGGIILRQLLPVTQFLAKMPVESSSLPQQQQQEASLLAVMRQSGIFSNSESNQAIDPRTLFSSHPFHQQQQQQESQQFSFSSTPNGLDQEAEEKAEEVKRGHIPESIFTSELETFDIHRKRREVDICLEALAQLGYAWPTMDVEMAAIEEIMRAQRL